MDLSVVQGATESASDVLESFLSHPERVIPATNEGTLVQMLKIIEEEFTFQDDMSIFIEWCNERFGLEEGADWKLVKHGHIKRLYQAQRLFYRFLSQNMIDEPDNDANDYLLRFSKLFSIIFNIKEILMSAQTITMLSSADYETTVFMNMGDLKVTHFDLAELSSYQKLILFFLNLLYNNGYRKYKDMVFRQIYSSYDDFEYATRAWEPLCHIKEYVYKAIDKEENFKMWMNFTDRKDNPKSVADYLMLCDDRQFDKLEIDRHLFSFKNGIFEASTLKFYPWSKVSLLDPKKASCKYHDYVFDTNFLTDKYGTPEEIPTPHFDKILNTQKIPQEAIDWIYVLLGRLMFDLGEYDDWEVIPFFKGLAGTGKSSIGKTLTQFYNPGDISVMSPNMEQQFGLSALYESFIWICYEVANKTWKLCQSDFQSMVSAEVVSIARKFKEAIVSKQWVSPGLLMGNEIPPFMDTGGNLFRRIVIIPFMVKVLDSEPGLLKEIRKETPALIAKFAICYLLAVTKHGRKDIWKVLPEWFHTQRNKLREQTSPLHGFLHGSNMVERELSNYMPKNTFFELFDKWLNERSEKPPRMKTTQYDSFFAEEGITTQIAEERAWHGLTQKDTWLVGVGLK